LWKGREILFPIALVQAQSTKRLEVEGKARSLASADYGVTGYPTTIMIDPEGRVVDHADEFLHAEEGLEKLEKPLNARSARR
jgi:hypothetical protein